MSDLSVKALVEVGAHIGCRISRWNPKMEPYIHGSRNRIHIIDLKETIRGILRSKHVIKEVIASGQDVLFVGTKPQLRSEVAKMHETTGMPYVDDRWIGGTLTNYEVIGSRIAYLEDLERKEREGFVATLSSKAAARFNREKRKIFRNLHGIRDMFRLPGAMIVIDPKNERNAVLEAKRMGIMVLGVVDTDCDPDACDVVIPANDDAIRSVAYILDHLKDAVEDGKVLRKERGVAAPTKPEPMPAGARGGKVKAKVVAVLVVARVAQVAAAVAVKAAQAAVLAAQAAVLAVVARVAQLQVLLAQLSLVVSTARSSSNAMTKRLQPQRLQPQRLLPQRLLPQRLLPLKLQKLLPFQPQRPRQPMHQPPIRLSSQT